MASAPREDYDDSDDDDIIPEDQFCDNSLCQWEAVFVVGNELIGRFYLCAQCKDAYDIGFEHGNSARKDTDATRK